jgi:DNA-binding Lrp family transcriptional regulator
MCSEPFSAKEVNVKTALDQLDYTLLRALQQDARLSNVELARRVDLSPTGVQKRLRRLEEAGVITGYVALVDAEALGYDMLCFVQVTLQRHEPDAVENFRREVQAMPEVLECHHLTGEADYLLKVVVRNRKHLERFLLETLTPVRGMDKIRTSLVLSEIKSTAAIPLCGPQDAD